VDAVGLVRRGRAAAVVSERGLGVARDHVAAAAAVDDIVAGAGVDVVLAIAAKTGPGGRVAARVRPPAREAGVVVGAADDGVVAAASHDEVLAVGAVRLAGAPWVAGRVGGQRAVGRDADLVVAAAGPNRVGPP